MKTKMIILGLVMLLVGAGIVYAIQTYTFTETATVKEFGATIEIKDPLVVDWTLLGETDAIPWGLVDQGGTYEYDIRITNTGTVEFTVALTTDVHIIYTNWLETWNLEGDSVALSSSITGKLTLDVPSEADLGLHTWTSNIDCIE